MKIRYQGGPLNRRSFYGPSAQPKYRDADGTVIAYEQGRTLTAKRSRDEAAQAAVYIYNPQQCTYAFISKIVQECDTATLRRELEQELQPNTAPGLIGALL